MFGLLGPNGAGKTTTVEILEGYRARTGGEVSVLGYDPAKRQIELRRRIGIVLQSGGIYSHVTPREALRALGELLPAPARRRGGDALAGLEEKADARSRTLSGGQLRRLDFALALVGDPELIFLDEPTTGFDPAARRDAWETVRNLREGGQDDPADDALPRRGAGAGGPGGDRQGRARAGGRAAARVRSSPVGAAQYTIAYRDANGERIERQTEDPTRLLNELTDEAWREASAWRS